MSPSTTPLQKGPRWLDFSHPYPTIEDTMKNKFTTTFKKIKTNDGDKIVARVWDTYSQVWRMFSDYDSIPPSIKAAMMPEERDLIYIKLA
jgi:hypothetical protein